jgi:hypothetical protein
VKIAATEVAHAVKGMVQLTTGRERMRNVNNNYSSGLTGKTGGIIVVCHAEELSVKMLPTKR